MKKLVFIVAMAATLPALAQNINDVVSYGTQNTLGTARYQAMSGAFGALGGDLSAININPAGSAVFNNSLFTVTGANYHSNHEGFYFGTFTENNFNNFQLNQLGGAFVLKNQNEKAPWKKVAFAFNYDMANNFNNEYFVRGNSPNSIDQYFVNFANGFVLDEISALPGESISDAYFNIGSDPNLGYPALQGFLGFEGFIIDPVSDDPNNTEYISNASFTGTVNQDYYVRTFGNDSKFNLNVSGQYTQNLYLGMSFNFQGIDRRRVTEFSESGYDAASTLQDVFFVNDLRTFGSAFSFGLGGIAKLNETIRVGASYESPTWFTLTDELFQYLETGVNSSGAPSTVVVDPNITFVFPEYRVFIPSKLTGSVALVFGQQGLISFDYSYQDMTNAELRPASDAFFNSQNQLISTSLKAVSTYRVGGEYKIKRLSLRGGYRFEESPYENETTVGDLTGYSLGIGYNFGATRLDVGFNQTEREFNQALFDTGLTNAPLIRRNDTNVAVSLTFNL